MRTLMGWIVGVLALGLWVGSHLPARSAFEASDAETLDAASAEESPVVVDCGEGFQALLQPAGQGGVTRVECVPSEIRTVVPAARSVSNGYLAPQPAYYATQPAYDAPRPVAAPAPAPVAREVVTERRSSRNWKDSVLIIGGSAGAGAGIGALAGGKKGAAVGAAIGGTAGTVYDLATRKKN